MAKRGRPTKQAKPGTKVSLGLKVTAKVKDLLEAEAAKSGRTQSQEAEYRLERSFYSDRLLSYLREDFLEFLYISSMDINPELRRRMLQQYLKGIDAKRAKS